MTGRTRGRRGGPGASAVPLAVAVAIAVPLAWVVAPAPAAAQAVRGWVGTTIQAVELRPFGSTDPDCGGSACYIPLDEELAVAATQDVSLTAWGFGVQGVSATVLLRSRARLGSEALWPRSDDRFDAVLAYAQLVRDGFTLRLGRQEIRSGLGFPSFDGATATWNVRSHAFRVEAYGGRSLARGLREPVREAFRAVEDFVPEQSVYLFGGSALGRLPGISATMRYQREILADRSQLASERGSLDFVLSTAHGTVAGAVDYDFAHDAPGKARLAWSRPLADARWMVEAAAVRYVPYFSLSTIWGFFEPVAYHGVEGRLGWSPSATTGAWVEAGWRRYGDAEVSTVLRPLQDEGRRVGVGGRWVPMSELALQGAYRLESSPGGFLSSADLSARYTVSERGSVGGSVSTFQQIEEFRLGDGRGLGAGVSADFELSARVRWSGGASLLHHSKGGLGPSESPWNQSRGWTSLRVLVGDDPGLSAGRR